MGELIALSYIEDAGMSKSKCKSMTEYTKVNGSRYPSPLIQTSDKVRVNEGNGLDWEKRGRRFRIVNRHINPSDIVDRSRPRMFLNLYKKYKKRRK